MRVDWSRGLFWIAFVVVFGGGLLFTAAQTLGGLICAPDRGQAYVRTLDKIDTSVLSQVR
jgi:hypothetical protein